MTKDSLSPLDVDQAFREHGAWLVAAVARKVAAPRATVEDACSHAWMQAWEHRDQLAGTSAFRLRGWLLLVAMREGWRLTGRDVVGVVDVADSVAASVAAPDQLVGLLDRLEVDGLLDALTDHQRRVAVLYAAGFTYEQIASALGIKVNAVNRALTRIKARGQRHGR